MLKRIIVILLAVGALGAGAGLWWVNSGADSLKAQNQTDIATNMQTSWAATGGLEPQKGVPQLGFTPDSSAPFAVLHVPAFGKDYKRPVAQGIDTALVLQKYGFGHLASTPLPGFPGNMVFTGYRNHDGSSLANLSSVKVGDHIYVETLWGWYDYLVNNARKVGAKETTYLNPVPFTEKAVDGYYLTIVIAGERKDAADSFVASAKYTKFYPRAAGAPAELK